MAVIICRRHRTSDHAPLRGLLSPGAQAILSLGRHSGRINTPRELRIPTYGLGCGGGGAGTIERELARMPGVLRVYVNPATETAYDGCDPARTDAWRLARVIEQAGYQSGRAVEA